MSKLKIGLVGLRFGQYHAHTLAHLDGVELTAVADRSASSETLADYAQRYGCRTYSDGLEMLERETLDGLSLCISPRFRASLIEKAAERNIALFIEKPWAANNTQAQELVTLCERVNARVMVGFSFRYHPAIVRLRQLMDSELGAGWLLNGEYVFDWLPPSSFWLWDEGNGGGFFNENSCHLFDAVCHLMGEPASVMAEAINVKGSPSEEAAAVTIRFASGGIAALTIGGLGARGRQDYPRLDVTTENGQAHLAGRHHIWEALTWTLRGQDLTHTLTAPVEALSRTRYSDAFAHFAECLRTGQPFSATIAEGVRSVKLASAIYESARTGQKVAL